MGYDYRNQVWGWIDELIGPPPELIERLSLKTVSKIFTQGPTLRSLFQQNSGICSYCGDPMTLPHNHSYSGGKTPPAVVIPRPTDVTRDHIRPKVDGNPGYAFNIAASCSRCNGDKSDLPLLMFLLGRKTNRLAEYRENNRLVRAAQNEELAA